MNDSRVCQAASQEGVGGGGGASERRQNEMSVRLRVWRQKNSQDEGGDTALMRASYFGNLATVVVLLRAGAEVNATNNDGETAALLAEEGRQFRTVELLKSAGGRAAKTKD